MAGSDHRVITTSPYTVGSDADIEELAQEVARQLHERGAAIVPPFINIEVVQDPDDLTRLRYNVTMVR